MTRVWVCDVGLTSVYNDVPVNTNFLLALLSPPRPLLPGVLTVRTTLSPQQAEDRRLLTVGRTPPLAPPPLPPPPKHPATSSSRSPVTPPLLPPASSSSPPNCLQLRLFLERERETDTSVSPAGRTSTSTPRPPTPSDSRTLFILWRFFFWLFSRERTNVRLNSGSCAFDNFVTLLLCIFRKRFFSEGYIKRSSIFIRNVLDFSFFQRLGVGRVGGAAPLPSETPPQCTCLF